MNTTERAVVRRTAWIRGRAARVSALISILALAGAGAAIASSTTIIHAKNSAKFGWMLQGPSRFSLYVWVPGTGSYGKAHYSPNRPPEIAHGRVVAASGAHMNSHKLSTHKLKNGQRQVTYYGEPLYLYKGDKAPGQTKGENRQQNNGVWLLISNTGRPIPPPGY